MVEQIWPAHVPPMCRPCAALIRNLPSSAFTKEAPPLGAAEIVSEFIAKKLWAWIIAPLGRIVFQIAFVALGSLWENGYCKIFSTGFRSDFCRARSPTICEGPKP